MNKLRSDKTKVGFKSSFRNEKCKIHLEQNRGSCKGNNISLKQAFKRNPKGERCTNCGSRVLSEQTYPCT